VVCAVPKPCSRTFAAQNPRHEAYQ
jgi:hypothetical protein